MHDQGLLMLGFGQLMRGLLTRLDPTIPVVAVSRRPPEDGLPGDRSPKNFRHIPGDLGEALPDALRGESFAQVVVCLSPNGQQASDYRHVFETALDNILKGLATATPAHLLFVSSTSVYGQRDGEWVDEASPTEPDSFSGQILRAAEQRVHAAGYPTTCVRFSGIYGGRRTRLLEGVRRGEYATVGPSPYTNRIHEDDAIGVLDHLLSLARQGRPLHPCYLASDCEPAPLHEVVHWIRRQLELPEVPPDAHASTTGPVAGRRAGSKRCNNRQLLESGYAFRYPGYREGYARMIADGA